MTTSRPRRKFFSGRKKAGVAPTPSQEASEATTLNQIYHQLLSYYTEPCAAPDS